MKKIILFCFLLSVALSCKKKDQEKTKPNKIDQPVQQDENNNKTPNEITNATNTSLNYKLLQGKWQSMLDAKSTTEFKNNQKIDTYEGIGETSNAQFLLSDDCIVIANPKKWNHIVLTESQFCYKIVDIDNQNLEISFTGTKTTLAYKKIK
jgi:hypothetical protein